MIKKTGKIVDRHSFRSKLIVFNLISAITIDFTLNGHTNIFKSRLDLLALSASHPFRSWPRFLISLNEEINGGGYW